MSIARRRLLNGMLASVLTGGTVLRTKSASAAGGAPSFIFALPGPGLTSATHMPFFLGKPYDWYVGLNVEDPNGDPMTIEAVTTLPVGFTVDSVGKRLRWDGKGVEGITNGLKLAVRNTHGSVGQSAEFTIRVFKIAAMSAQFVRYPVPKLYGNRPLLECKHIRMAIYPLNGRVYILGGDYNGGQGQNQSGRWELWSFDPETPNDWRLEYPYFGPAGEVQPAGPDEATFVWDPVRKMFLSGPGNYGYHAGLVRPGFSTGIGQNHICGFDPITKKWTDLGKYTGSTGTEVYGHLVGRELIGGFDWDAIWHINADTLIGGMVQSGAAGYVGYSQQSAYDGDHTMYFYDYRGRLIKGDTVTKKLELVMNDLPSVSRLFVNMVWNPGEKLLEVWVPQGASGFGQLIAIDPATKQWWVCGSDARGNMMLHYPGKGTFLVGGLAEAALPVDRISKVIVKRAGSTVEVLPVVVPPITGWWSGIPKNTWHAIPGTTYTTNFDRTGYIAAGVKGRFGGIQEFGGFAPDRLNSRFLWAACGGGAGAHSGNDGGEFNLKVPGIRLLFTPDDAGSLWTDGAHALNRYGRPNSTHASRSLVYSPRTRTLFKFSQGQTWERDAGNFGDVFEARVEGNMGWEPSDKHPLMPSTPNIATLDWRLVDWRSGDLYIANDDKVYKYNEATKIHTLFIASLTTIGRGAIALLESANKALLIGQQTAEQVVQGVKLRAWEIDLATGKLVAAAITGPAGANITYSTSHGLASDPVGDCLWFFKDDQKLYRLTRAGNATWEATVYPLAGTPPELYGSGVRNGNEGKGCGIYNGFDYFPELKGLAWIQRTDRPAFYVRLYG